MRFVALDQRVEIRCPSGPATDHLRHNFRAMSAWIEGESDLIYRITPNERTGLRLERLHSDFSATPRSMGELTYLLEGDLVVQLQVRRPDLLFLHAAVLERDGGAHLITGRSGAGKSTTCWGLLHHGFRYLSDELAPIVPGEHVVLPYPVALCMKDDPPADHPVPSGTPRTSRGLRLPADPWLPTAVSPPPVVRSIFFVDYERSRRTPSVDPVKPAEAAARIYPNILNALAHRNAGLAAASALATQVRAFRLRSGCLSATCRVVTERIRDLDSSPAGR